MKWGKFNTISFGVALQRIELEEKLQQSGCSLNKFTSLQFSKSNYYSVYFGFDFFCCESINLPCDCSQPSQCTMYVYHLVITDGSTLIISPCCAWQCMYSAVQPPLSLARSSICRGNIPNHNTPHITEKVHIANAVLCMQINEPLHRLPFQNNSFCFGILAALFTVTALYFTIFASRKFSTHYSPSVNKWHCEYTTQLHE